jgi:hypothetical protein
VDQRSESAEKALILKLKNIMGSQRWEKVKFIIIAGR